MIRLFLGLGLIVATSVTGLFSNQAQANAGGGGYACSVLFAAPQPVGRSARWRESQTNFGAQVFKTNSSIESELKSDVANVRRAVMNDSSTVAISMYTEPSVQIQTIRPPADYGTGIYPQYGLSRLKPDGNVNLLLVLPVSGHAGLENAIAWAKTDTYNIQIEKQDANGYWQNDTLISGVPSKGLATIHELTLKMDPSVLYRLSYWRDGSAGPGGYPEGRYIELVWSGR